MQELAHKSQLAYSFVQRYDNDISGLSLKKLEAGDHELDRQVHHAFKERPNWQAEILQFASWAETMSLKESESPISDQLEFKEPPSQREKHQSVQSGRPMDETSSDSWKFTLPMGYIRSITETTGEFSRTSISTSAALIVDSRITPEEFAEERNSSTREVANLSKVDALIGSFDTESNGLQMLSQKNTEITLAQVDLNSLSRYQELYKEHTNYYTKSAACDVLGVPRKEQIITVSVDETQFKVDIYSFSKGGKSVWGKLPVTKHNMGIAQDSICGLDISTEQNQTKDAIILVIVLSGFTNDGKLVTSIIRLTINIPSKQIRLNKVQCLISVQSYENVRFLGSLNPSVICLNGFVYLNLHKFHSNNLVGYKWTGLEYIQIWDKKYPVAIANLQDWVWMTQTTMLHNIGNVIYFLYSENQHQCLEIFSQKSNGTLNRDEEMRRAFESDEGDFWNYSRGTHIGEQLYIVQDCSKLSPSSAGISNVKVTKRIFKLNKDDRQFEIVDKGYKRDSKDFQIWPSAVAFSNKEISTRDPRNYTITHRLQPLAVLDAIPFSSLIDYADGEIPTLTFTSQSSKQEKRNIVFKTSQSKSKKLETSFNSIGDIFGTKINAVVSSRFDKSTENAYTSTKEVIQSEIIEVDKQDVVLYVGINYEVYEYPVFIGDEPSGRFLFVRPSSQPMKLSELGRNLFRRASHQAGNLLSYPPREPEDIQRLLWGKEISVNPNMHRTYKIEFKDLNNETNSTSISATTTVSGSVSIGVEFPAIVSLSTEIESNLEESYHQLELSSYTIENTFSLELNLPRLPPPDQDIKDFKIHPYFYIDQANMIRLSYAVRVPVNKVLPTYWQQYYEHPDLGMVIPYLGLKKSSLKLLSLDIKTELIEEDRKLRITSTVRNWSLKRAKNVTVRFYYSEEKILTSTFDVNNKEKLTIVGDKQIDILHPRDSQDLSIDLEYTNEISSALETMGYIPVFVEIDPDNHIKEMSKDNNFALSVYPVTVLYRQFQQFLSSPADF
ncbi:hypothetical protein GCM10008090_34090 [Arenicella chitinivorans]|uniref:CARDB domain-containing protein n=2 Tax=Arenicella chitinivorans TaxID=1329800 RepID=A0A918VSP9_9GAMM|nr:hypothetical protein GCM10008090_34090 [Arenicella chitinivorans]